MEALITKQINDAFKKLIGAWTVYNRYVLKYLSHLTIKSETVIVTEFVHNANNFKNFYHLVESKACDEEMFIKIIIQVFMTLEVITKLVPDFGHGGASVVTNTSSGGGGGGGGYFGGAAGAWNNVSKPNNVHGSGGGGSSYQGLLESTTPDGNVCLNLYKSQYSNWTNRSNSKYGYMVLGLKVNS